jgi:hypothetical protein
MDNWEQVAQNSADLFGATGADRATGGFLGQMPTRAPAFLVPSGQNPAAKLFRFVEKL